jgi:hypothetical protein
MATHEDLSRAQDTKTSSNRGFGWVFTGAFLVVALWPLVRGDAPRWWALPVSGVFLVVTLLAPALLALPNHLWMRIGALLHRIVSPVVLGFLFYVVVTPMGMLMRAFSKGDARWRRGGSAGSYWIRRDPPGPKPDSLRNQF